MALQSVVNSDLYVNGGLSAKTFKAPDGSITNSMIQASAGIDASKVVHQLAVKVASPGTVATKSEICHICYGAATIVAFQVFIGTHPTSSDSVVVDLQRSTAGGAFATVLSSAITLNSGSTSLIVYPATISSATLIAGDALRVVATATGSTGADLVSVAVLREQPV